MLFFSVVVFTDNVLANEITPLYNVKHDLEGEKTTLSCSYSGSNINSLQWYRQHPNTAPEFLLQAFEGLGRQEKDNYVAKVRKDEKQLDLEISKTEIADTAIYYCALVPTVTGNPSTLYKNLTNT
ncbi:T-cell receptor alpha chain V region CTL-F3 [Anabarilius grahami]|nr:T-cell receptor alpha chain V region CTL-F3 [Anabarilius grahami]